MLANLVRRGEAQPSERSEERPHGVGPDEAPDKETRRVVVGWSEVE